MIQFFSRKKCGIDSIIIPDFGWNKEKDDQTIIQWINPEQTMALSINYFDLEPDLPSLKEINIIRSFYRDQIIQHNGGLIQVDYSNLKDYNAVRTIFKIPQEPSGIIYLASLTIPFNTCSYVIKIQAPEIGMTGMRDSIIADRLLQQGIINAGEDGFENWFSDPYDKTIQQGTLMNQSEEPAYDAEFEKHPLSQARKLMSEIERKVEFKPELKKLRKYEK